MLAENKFLWFLEMISDHLSLFGGEGVTPSGIQSVSWLCAMAAFGDHWWSRSFELD